ncbi:uncharacterized protein SPPG_06309 [Spizellomyces punctatus DAOM BR117]|uniref:C3H1-type domain-containing protein n=1 Tax=Spizellomyces punctatus (strain DAOM BR117) TaxID=645134 RepID=A0A0L0HBR9_SPIPD|nr:uncharacterized protein SPPG_06309 [Spizellomyces punctatus DAOM BR117]KNC98627.1 hypothetical protein SPPG_06309 [Spizellomyces punctatus DAOM BR117]|eukprot:XP_016606667.1 hypothetical protein SPPG_06309 [Spizellomyces punctatus DAOM BR117]
MHLDDASSTVLKKLLTSQLQPICDADPIVLADYVIALLKHDKPIADLKALCISQLDDFLKEATQPFVLQLFDSLASLGFLENEPQAVGNQAALPRHQHLHTSAPTTGLEEPLQPTPRKVFEEDASEDEDGDRNFKHTRRGGRESSSDKASPAADLGDRRVVQNDRPRADESAGRKRGRGEDNMYPPQALDPSSQTAGYPSSKQAKYEVHNTSEHKRRRSDEQGADDGDVHRAKVTRGYNGPAPTGYGNGSTRRAEYERDGRDRDMRALNQRYPQMLPNQGVPPGRWDGGPDWSNTHPTSGAPLAEREARFIDRNNGRYRGRMPDRLGRGGMGPTRGGYMNGRGRRPCRDYEERGYCLRGDACPYDHGVDRIVVDDIPMVGGRPPFDLMGPAPLGPMTGMRAPFSVPYNAGVSGRTQYEIEPYEPGMQISLASEGYDPERASFASAARAGGENGGLGKGDNQAAAGAPFNVPQGHGGPISTSPDISRGGFRNPRGFSRRGGGRGGFFGHSSQRGDTLCVQSIPPEFCSIDKINAFFKKFGTITNIKLDVPSSKAVVQFSRHQEAMAAYRSPDPIFGNRFVRVFWFNSDASAADFKAGADVQTPAVPQRASVVHPDPISSGPDDISATTAAKVAAAEEKKEKAKQMLEMQQSLISKQLEEQKNIMEKLQSKNLTPKEKKALLDQFEILSKSLKDVMDSASNQVSAVKGKGGPVSRTTIMEEKERERLDRELDALNQISTADPEQGGRAPDAALVAELEALKAQAAERGIDPAAVIAAATIPRGGGTYSRGRGRGSWGVGRGGSRYTLDNRPTKIRVEGLISPAHLALRSHFERFGTVSGLTLSEDNTMAVVQFASRRDAEKAMSEPLTFVGADKAKLSWFTGHLATPIGNSSEEEIGIADREITAAKGGETSELGLDATKTWEEEDDDDDDNETSWKRR